MSRDITPTPGGGLVYVDTAGRFRLIHDGSAPEVMRARIDETVQWLLSRPGEHKELAVEHELVGGMYVRKLYIPAGTFLAGKIHRRHCINVVQSGCLDVLTEFGSRTLHAGFFGASPPGIQKIGMAHEDTVFINIFRTDEVDIERIEAEIATTDRGALKELECL